MKIAVYAEHCTMAGQRNWKAEDEGRKETEDNADVLWVRASRAEARIYRKMAKTAGAGRDLYFRRIAETIEEAI